MRTKVFEPSELDAARAAFMNRHADNPMLSHIPPGYRLSDEAMDRITLLSNANGRNERRVLRKAFAKCDAKKPFVTFVKK